MVGRGAIGPGLQGCLIVTFLPIEIVDTNNRRLLNLAQGSLMVNFSSAGSGKRRKLLLTKLLTLFKTVANTRYQSDLSNQVEGVKRMDRSRHAKKGLP